MENMKSRCTAIILAAGSGKRMQSAIPKQYLLLEEKPVLWYSLHTVETSGIIDDCILVTSAEDIDYVKKEIVNKYNLQKVRAVVAGGSERYESVHNGLQAIVTAIPETEYVFIHDGARPFLTERILKDTYAAVSEHNACVAGMPVKDTIKISDENGFIAQSPNRNLVWAVQTPQVFERALVTKAYEDLMEQAEDLKAKGVNITDDTSVVEMFTGVSAKLVEASYENIKITTPEDLVVAESFLHK